MHRGDAVVSIGGAAAPSDIDAAEWRAAEASELTVRRRAGQPAEATVPLLHGATPSSPRRRLVARSTILGTATPAGLNLAVLESDRSIGHGVGADATRDARRQSPRRAVKQRKPP